MSPLIALMSSKCYSHFFTYVDLRLGEVLTSHCFSNSRQLWLCIFIQSVFKLHLCRTDLKDECETLESDPGRNVELTTCVGMAKVGSFLSP